MPPLGFLHMRHPSEASIAGKLCQASVTWWALQSSPALSLLSEAITHLPKAVHPASGELQQKGVEHVHSRVTQHKIMLMIAHEFSVW